MCKELDFNNDDHKSLFKRIFSGEIVLFLGSGFSMGAIGSLVDEETGRKLPIPNVTQLKNILSSRILYTDYDDIKLKELCEECQEDNGARYAQLMKDIFRVSDIRDFHRLYSEIDWKKIFTTNVDDLIEKVYADSDKKINTIYSEKPKYIERSSVTYYKLHGDAIIAPDKITFSTSDYVVSSARRNDYRFEALSFALKTDNFLFLGTSLNEEWDFDIWCQQTDAYLVTNKTYFILNEYNDRLAKRIRRRFKNAILIKETAETFIKKVIEYGKSLPLKDKNISYDKWSLKHVNKRDYDVTNYLKPDLYLGAEPTWEDVFSNHDVIWEKTQEVINKLQASKDWWCTLIIGQPVSGKTTMLYRIGVTLCESEKVFEYVGDNFFEDIKDYHNYVSKSESIIILVDDANWILGRIDDLVGCLEDANVKLIATVREKEYEKKQHLFEKIEKIKINLIRDINNLSKKDIGLYLDKLSEKSFLGKYSKGYNEKKEKMINYLEEEMHKKKEDPLLWLAFKMKYGEKLNQRINNLSDRIITNDNYNIKRFVVLLYFLDVVGDTGLKLSLFLDLYPMKTEVLNNFIIDIQDLMISNINKKSWQNSIYEKINIHGRLSEITKKAVKKINRYELKEIVEDIFRRLESAYHYKCRQPNSYQNYVLYTLLRSQNISELFRNKKGGIEWKYISQLYENLHGYFGDYHIYWLHRGISEIKMKNYTSATIHLEQARDVRKSYSYEIEHTFAILYFEEATNLTDLSDAERKGMLNNALSIIRMQIGREENDAFSIHSFVVKTILFYESCNQQVPDNLMKDILNYYYMARKRFELSQSIIRRNMLICIYKYLSQHNMLYDYNLSVTQDELAYFNRRIGENEINYDVLDFI